MYLSTEPEGDWTAATEETDFLDIIKSIKQGDGEDLIERCEAIDEEE